MHTISVLRKRDHYTWDSKFSAHPTVRRAWPSLLCRLLVGDRRDHRLMVALHRYCGARAPPFLPIAMEAHGDGRLIRPSNRRFGQQIRRIPGSGTDTTTHVGVHKIRTAISAFSRKELEEGRGGAGQKGTGGGEGWVDGWMDGIVRGNQEN